MQIRVLDEAGVRRHPIAGLDHDDVAGNDLVGRDSLALAVADHGRFGRCKRHQRSNGALGARLLEEAEQGVEHDDEQDDDRLIGQGGLARILQQPLDHGDDGGDEQDDHQEVLELLDQPRPPGRFRRALELVRTVLLEAPLRLRCGSSRAPGPRPAPRPPPAPARDGARSQECRRARHPRDVDHRPVRSRCRLDF